MKKLFSFCTILLSVILVSAQQHYPYGQFHDIKPQFTVSDSSNNSFNDEYYNKELSKAKNKTFIGGVLIAAGTGLLIGGASRVSKNYNNYLNYGDEANGSGLGMIIFGMASLGVGIPLTITGGVKIHKYKEAIEASKNSASLSFGTTTHGIGLTLSF